MKLNRSYIYILPAALMTIALLSACATNRSVGEQIDDRTITGKINAKLAADPEVNPFNVDVDTLDGAVTLRGEVEKIAARQEAEKHARNVLPATTSPPDPSLVTPPPPESAHPPLAPPPDPDRR